MSVLRLLAVVGLQAGWASQHSCLCVRLSHESAGTLKYRIGPQYVLASQGHAGVLHLVNSQGGTVTRISLEKKDSSRPTVAGSAR